jgi:hypothetical protein
MLSRDIGKVCKKQKFVEIMVIVDVLLFNDAGFKPIVCILQFLTSIANINFPSKFSYAK